MSRREKVENIMVDRQLFGDLALAVALVFPTAALARSEALSPRAAATSPIIAHHQFTERSVARSGLGLLG